MADSDTLSAMPTVSNKPAVIDPDSELIQADTNAISAITRGEVDLQVATARRYPRSVVTFQREAGELATQDAETAASCIYSLPRRDKEGQTVRVKGPSIRLAEILAHAYGHLRVEGRPVGEADGFVVCRGTAWDCQKNVLIAIETRRRITGRNGRRFSDDMVSTTTNACTSIALRNAILHTIPKTYWQPIYEAAVKAAVGDQKTLSERRQRAMEHFQKMGIQPAQVYQKLGVKGMAEITTDHLEDLFGLATAIKEGEISIDEVFREEALTGPLPENIDAAGDKVLASHVIQAGADRGWKPEQTMEFVKARFQKDLMSLGKGAECIAAIKALRQEPTEP